MKKMLLAALFFFSLPTLGFASCTPAPPGLGFQQWVQECQVQLEQVYEQDSQGLDRQTFAQYAYQLYVANTTPRLGGGGGGGGVPYATAPCQQAGATFCNSSHWLLQCNGSQWLTGATQC